MGQGTLIERWHWESQEQELLSHTEKMGRRENLALVQWHTVPMLFFGMSVQENSHICFFSVLME